jgi:GNAT superfamily N-acetyltransferase
MPISASPKGGEAVTVCPMTSLVIDVRPAREADASGLAEVHAAAWREAYAGIIPALTLERMIARRGAPWWRGMLGRRMLLVLEVGGAIAGYASVAPASGRGRPGAAELQELYLAPQYQGIGLGARLFTAALKAVKQRGFGRILVRALDANDRAKEFYRRRGGRLVARTEETLGDRTLPCIWYEIRM